MIEIDAAFDEAGLLSSCTVRGHAGQGPKGGDIVCAAVSVLTRTALRVLSTQEGVSLRGGAPGRGVFRIETNAAGEGRAFLFAAGTFLVEGLRSVSDEYPEYCTMNIRRERRK
jgi:uncharacterized protein YsxB (DUF464 family)